jgi:hypothetical protein
MAAKTDKTEKKAQKAPKAEPKAEPAKQTTKLATFLTSKKIDPRRVMSVSHGLETLQAEDRQIKLSKRAAKAAEGEAKPKEERKPRSGRPVTPRAMTAALSGGSLSGPSKQRILRAVNHLLEQKKAEKVDFRTLF